MGAEQSMAAGARLGWAVKIGWAYFRGGTPLALQKMSQAEATRMRASAALPLGRELAHRREERDHVAPLDGLEDG